MTQNHSSIPPWLGTVLKVAFTAGLFWLVATRVEWGDLKLGISTVTPSTIVIVLVLVCIQMVLLTLRWRWITQSMGHQLTIRDGLAAQLVSQFFNQGLPSSIGGDGVRTWWLTRNGLSLGDALRNVLFDRLVGFAALLVLVAGSVVVMWRLAGGTASGSILTAALAGGLAVVGIGFFWIIARIPVDKLPEGRLRNLAMRLVTFLAGFGTILARLARSPRDASLVAGSSLVIHLMTVAIGFGIASSCGMSISFLGCFAAVLPACLVAYLPFSIAGWGVREVAMIHSFSLIGVPSADALLISVIMGAGFLIVSLTGGLVFLFSKLAVRMQQPA